MSRSALLHGLVLLILAPNGAGAGSLARLEVEHAPDAIQCPGRDELSEEVRLRRGEDVIGQDAGRLIKVFFEHTPGGYRATVQLLDRQGSELGSRMLEATGECSTMTRAVAFVLSLAIDGEGLAAPAATTVTVTPPPTAAAEPAVSLQTVVRTRSARRVAATIEARMARGRLPGTSAGGAARIELGVRAWYISLGVAGLFGHDDALVDNHGASVWLVSGELGVCRELVLRTDLRGSVCVGGDGGALHASGSGYDRNFDTVVPDAGAWASARVAWRFRGVEPYIDLGGRLGIARPDIIGMEATGAEQQLFRSAPTTGELAAGLRFVFF